VVSFTNYAQVQRLLSESHALTEAAEAHGTLAGALCAAGTYRLEDWLAEILPEGSMGTAGAQPLRDLYEQTCGALQGAQMQFDLLMPADSEPLGLRTEALTLWCNGFVYGLGTGGASDPQQLPGDASEIVRDLTQIMLAGVDENDGQEANEAALAELIEFVRVGVQVVFEDLSALRARPRAAEAGAALH